MKKINNCIWLFILILIISTICLTGVFLRNVSAKENVQQLSEKNIPSSNNFFQSSLKKLSRIQRDLRKRIVKSTKALKKEASPRHFMIIIFFSFIFGVIHSLGPGHAKSIIFSYFMSVDARIKDGVVLGVLVAIIHGASGFLAAVLITFSIDQLIQRFAPGLDFEKIFPFISGAFVSVIGAYFFIQTCLDVQCHSLELEEKVARKHSFRTIFLTALGVGVIPCAGTVILVSFFFAMKRIDLGMISAFAMTAGMAIIIVLAGIIAILSKKIFMSICSRQIERVTLAIKFIGSLALFVFGILLLCP